MLSVAWNIHIFTPTISFQASHVSVANISDGIFSKKTQAVFLVCEGETILKSNPSLPLTTCSPVYHPALFYDSYAN